MCTGAGACVHVGGGHTLLAVVLFVWCSSAPSLGHEVDSS